ncbi:nickel/cobalt transporter [Martelella radicis]|uniref:Nickel/cobalt efflux system n=1 Tax=Martelella radicis TaxID=1397476 RepID=A0A7W6PBU6_9HYPH|nr:nickel/cobalt transporter [Martelella radicis]MBB4123821.1 ABC-type nickel/cobalt efflux system permease component RcnA [Martelella radicis]
MRLARPLLAVFLMVLAFVAGAKFAAAQSPLGIGASEPSFSSSFGPFQGLLITINHYQQQFYRALTGALKAMQDDPVKVLGLVGLSFAYGVFHAAGPGHGKAVISSYMIANEIELKRGILISLLSSLAQGLTAVLLVGAAYLVLRRTAVSMGDATVFMERASFLLIAGFGAWLVFSKSRPLFSGHDGHALALAGAGGDHHGHDHDHAHADHHHHHDDHHHAAHDHVHGPDCGCGHAHMPEPSTLGGKDFDWKGAGAAILAIGMRPCSGALIVLTFALLNGLILGGIASVFAMAIGTAITVSALAIIAVSAKGLAIRLAGPGSGRATTIGRVIEIGGAFLVMLMGLTLFAASMAG